MTQPITQDTRTQTILKQLTELIPTIQAKDASPLQPLLNELYQLHVQKNSQ